MVEEDNLSVVFTLDFDSLRSVSWWVHIGIDIDDLSVSLVSEKEALIIVGVHSKIGRVIKRGVLCIPVEETEVCGFWQQLLLSFEDVTEVLGLKPMSQVNVS